MERNELYAKLASLRSELYEAKQRYRRAERLLWDAQPERDYGETRTIKVSRRWAEDRAEVVEAHLEELRALTAGVPA